MLGFRLTATKLLSIVQVCHLVELAVRMPYAILDRKADASKTKSTLASTYERAVLRDMSPAVPTAAAEGRNSRAFDFHGEGKPRGTRQG